MADGIDVNVGIRVKLQRRSCAGSTRAFKLVYEVSMRSKEPQDKEVIVLNIIDSSMMCMLAMHTPILLPQD